MDFEDLLRTDEATLYAQYGRETGAGAAEPDPEAGGRARFGILLNNIKGRLCSDERVKSFVAGGVLADQTALCAVVLEILVFYLGANIPALPTAAVLVVKIGIGQVCASA